MSHLKRYDLVLLYLAVVGTLTLLTLVGVIRW